jgi:hypothetical protein
MSRATTTYAQGYGTPAAYKAQYQPLSQVLNTALPRSTTESGQVNWGTVTTEPTVTRDFEVFALGGPLAATAPLYVRVDYRGGANGFVAVAAGTSTDGAGNLGGLTVTSQPLYNDTVTNLVAPQSAWAASDGETYLTFVYALDPNLATPDGIGAFVVERTRDPDGTPNGSGFHVYRWQVTAPTATTFLGSWSRVYAAAQQPYYTDYDPHVFLPDAYNLSSTFKGTTSYAFPAMTYAGIVPGGASKALLFAFATDFPRGTPVTVQHYNSAMTFVPTAGAVSTNIPVMNNAGAGAVKGLSPMFRWD